MTVQAGLCRTWSELQIVVSLVRRLNLISRHTVIIFRKLRFPMDTTRAVRYESLLGYHVTHQVSHVRDHTGLSETRDLGPHVPRDLHNVYCVDSGGILSHGVDDNHCRSVVGTFQAPLSIDIPVNIFFSQVRTSSHRRY